MTVLSGIIDERRRKEMRLKIEEFRESNTPMLSRLERHRSNRLFSRQVESPAVWMSVEESNHGEIRKQQTLAKETKRSKPYALAELVKVVLLPPSISPYVPWSVKENQARKTRLRK